MRAAIDGVRKSKSYADIREDMKKDTRYESKTSNVFIFPDEDKYTELITNVLKIPVDIDTKLFVESVGGPPLPYSIEGDH